MFRPLAWLAHAQWRQVGLRAEQGQQSAAVRGPPVPGSAPHSSNWPLDRMGTAIPGGSDHQTAPWLCTVKPGSYFGCSTSSAGGLAGLSFQRPDRVSNAQRCGKLPPGRIYVVHNAKGLGHRRKQEAQPASDQENDLGRQRALSGHAEDSSPTQQRNAGSRWVRHREGRPQMNSRFIDPVGLILAMSGRLPPIPLAQIDCDELTTFLLAIAFFLDMPGEVVTVAADPSQPNQFTHVYLRLLHKQGGTIPFDLTSSPYPGPESMHMYRRRAWPLLTPIEISDFPESDRPTAQAVATVIATARASASHPEFQLFLRHLMRWLVEELSGLVRQEEERRSEVCQRSHESPGPYKIQGEPYFGMLSEGDLQKWAAWLAGCLTELQKDRGNLQGLLEGPPKLDIPAPTAEQTAEWTRLVLERLLARIASSGPGGV